MSFAAAVTIPSESTDTTPDAARVQVNLLRDASVARRLHLACSLSAAVVSTARRALARKNPHASSAELDVRFAAVHYGLDLAEALRAELTRRRALLDT
jgi:hypothetical protein